MSELWVYEIVLSSEILIGLLVGGSGAWFSFLFCGRGIICVLMVMVNISFIFIQKINDMLTITITLQLQKQSMDGNSTTNQCEAVVQ